MTVCYLTPAILRPFPTYPGETSIGDRRLIWRDFGPCRELQLPMKQRQKLKLISTQSPMGEINAWLVLPGNGS